MLISISIDVHGGDNGVNVTVVACLEALEIFDDIFLVLVGDDKQIQSVLDTHPLAKKYQSKYRIVHATQIISMKEDLRSALRKRDSSMRTSIHLVKSKQTQACVSAGNSGALMAIATVMLKTLPGIDRPAMFAKLPTTANHYTHMLDLGANIDSKASTLFGFAIMGSIAVQYTENLKSPRVALLNIGSEDIKGKQVIKDTAELLKVSSLNYVGFIEADTLYTKPVDVVVCDGFEGNLVLKASEGIVTLIKIYLKRSFSQNLYTKLATFLSMPVLKHFKKSLDPRTYNGASLLGLKGIVVKSHGNADVFSFLYAIKEARLEAKNNIADKIDQKIHQEMQQS